MITNTHNRIEGGITNTPGVVPRFLKRKPLLLSLTPIVRIF